MKHLRRLYLTLAGCLLLLAPLSSTAQALHGEWFVYGYITGCYFDTLEGAVIHFEGYDPVVSGPSGYYWIYLNTVPCWHNITVTAEAYNPFTMSQFISGSTQIDANLTQGGVNEQPRFVNLALTPGEPVELNFSFFNGGCVDTYIGVSAEYMYPGPQNWLGLIFPFSFTLFPGDACELNVPGSTDGLEPGGYDGAVFFSASGYQDFQYTLVHLDIVVGAPEPAPVTAFGFFPNPAGHLLNLTVPHPGGRIEILDPAGRVMLQHATAGETEFQLDISALAGGLYLVRYCNPGGILSQKLLVMNGNTH
jgi:hypothetical protein